MDNSEKAINLFVKSIILEDYPAAEDHLRDAVIEKIKARIRKCEQEADKK